MIIFLDTETTGIDVENRLCQLAYKVENGESKNLFFKPPTAISTEASSIHHITNEMVKDKIAFKESEEFNILQKIIDDEGILVAHNAEFDIKVLEWEGIRINKFVDTCKIVKYLEDLPRYNLQFLRYHYEMEIDATAHDASGDILFLEKLFYILRDKMQKKLVGNVIEKMIEISSKPLLLRRMPFGKYKSMPFERVPKDYLNWLSNQDIDGDLRYTVDYYLNENKN